MGAEPVLGGSRMPLIRWGASAYRLHLNKAGTMLLTKHGGRLVYLGAHEPACDNWHTIELVAEAERSFSCCETVSSGAG